MLEINCPFCNSKAISDIIASIEEVDGQWECENGHQFVVKYIPSMVIPKRIWNEHGYKDQKDFEDALIEEKDD